MKEYRKYVYILIASVLIAIVYRNYFHQSNMSITSIKEMNTAIENNWIKKANKQVSSNEITLLVKDIVWDNKDCYFTYSFIDDKTNEELVLKNCEFIEVKSDNPDGQLIEYYNLKDGKKVHKMHVNFGDDTKHMNLSLTKLTYQTDNGEKSIFGDWSISINLDNYSIKEDTISFRNIEYAYDNISLFTTSITAHPLSTVIKLEVSCDNEEFISKYDVSLLDSYGVRYDSNLIRHLDKDNTLVYEYDSIGRNKYKKLYLCIERKGINNSNYTGKYKLEMIE